MRIVQGMGLFTGALVISALMSAGCSSAASSGEEQNQSSLDQQISADPGALSDGECKKPKPDACTSGEIGNGKHCLDPSTVKDKAFKACDKDGFVLTELSITETCPGGLPSKASYTCCPTPPPPPPDPGPGSCIVGDLGDGLTCEDPGTIKTNAFLICDKDGLVLTELKLASDCAGGLSTKASYVCCDPNTPPPPPPPQDCSVSELGDGQTCQDLFVLKQAAYDACKLDGRELTDLKYVDGCPGGQSSKISFVCCAPSEPKPPPQTCSAGQLGDGATCQADSAFLTQAEDACLQAGLNFAGVKTTHDCPGGLSTYGYYTCCAPAQP